MRKKIAFLFPGQGAQYAGMGKDFYDQFRAAKKTFEEADSFLGCPFSQLIFEGPSEELTLTKNSQIAIYITSIAILRVVQEQYPELKPAFCAGLSLGEYTALTAAGYIDFLDCLGRAGFRRRHDHAPVNEQFAIGGLGAGGFLACNRMHRDQRHARFQQRLEFAHHPALDAADIGDDRVWRQMRNHRGEQCGHGANRHREHHQVGALGSLDRILGCEIDHAAIARDFEVDQGAAQSDRAIDQILFARD